MPSEDIQSFFCQGINGGWAINCNRSLWALWADKAEVACTDVTFSVMRKKDFFGSFGVGQIFALNALPRAAAVADYLKDTAKMLEDV